VEGRAGGPDLHVLLGGAELKRHGVGRQRPDDVEEESGRQDRHPVGLHRRLEGNAEAYLEIGGAELDCALERVDLSAGESLNRRVGGGDPGDGLQLREESVSRR
jgi:hypothetical protein